MTPRILVLDIETAPHIVASFGLFKQNISIDQIIEPGYILCWAAKWHGEKGTMFGAHWEDSGHEWLERLHVLITEADAVVHYNGDTFDMPWLNGEFEKAGLDPLPDPKSVDLYKTVKKLRLASGKLDWVARTFFAKRKVQTGGFKLWLAVMGYLGPEEQRRARKKMDRYNRADVVLTDLALGRFAPRIKNLPNVGEVRDDGTVTCPRPTCGSSHVQRRGVSRTSTGDYPRYQCQTCRGWFKTTRREAGHGVAAI